MLTGHSNYDDATGYRCDDCGTLFPATQAIEREYSVLEDSMYGRELLPVSKCDLCCPVCSNTELHPIAICQRCHEAQAMSGGDYCEPCEVIVEREDHDAHQRGAAETRSRELRAALIGIATGENE